LTGILATPRAVGSRPDRRRPDRPPRAVPADGPADRCPDDAHGPSVEALCTRWRAAFEAAEDALRAGRWDLSPAELRSRQRSLADERATTLAALKAVARARGADARYLHLVRRADVRRLLGLPADVVACVFNLDGVLIGSAALHAAAWREALDEFIWTRVERTHGRFPPFDPHLEYARYLHGKPRLEGVRRFLESRGVSLPEGTPGDPPGLETVHGLANRKNAALQRRLAEHGVQAYQGSLAYLDAVLEAGLRTAVVSASANTATILERAGLAPLVDCAVDGDAMLREHLRAKPAPDPILAACRRLDVSPEHAAAFETTAAGVEAALAAGTGIVIGIDQFGQAASLRAAGAAPVVSGLGEIIETRLAA
jgi:HAD superfamily hydrolase (TIGR01509 family)